MSDKNNLLVHTLEIIDTDYTPYKEGILSTGVRPTFAELDISICFRAHYIGNFEKYMTKDGDIDKFKILKDIRSGEINLKF